MTWTLGLHGLRSRLLTRFTGIPKRTAVKNCRGCPRKLFALRIHSYTLNERSKAEASGARTAEPPLVGVSVGIVAQAVLCCFFPAIFLSRRIRTKLQSIFPAAHSSGHPDGRCRF